MKKIIWLLIIALPITCAGILLMPGHADEPYFVGTDIMDSVENDSTVHLLGWRNEEYGYLEYVPTHYIPNDISPKDTLFVYGTEIADTLKIDTVITHKY